MDADADANNKAFERLAALITRADYDGALAYLRNLSPGEAEPWWITYHIGKVQGRRGDWEEALACLTEAARLAPRNPVVLHGLGIALHNLQRFEEAADAHAEATRLRHDYIEGWQSLGLAWLQGGAPDSAADAFRIALAHLARKGFAAAGFEVPPLANTASGLSDDEPLLRSFVLPPTVAADLIAEGRFARIVFHLGMAHVAADRHELAKEAFQNALKLGLDGVERHNAEGWLERHAAGEVPRRLN